jgi:predicted metal-dependent HD superfamily phosphohydrolase
VQYVLENDNEERSAAIARNSLTALGVGEDKIALCEEHILATKTHKSTPNSDTNLFTDADLSILGQPWKSYERYMKCIRQEYIVYPDNIYNAGRMKVLKHFLQMEKVYKTEHFYNLYEASGRENMAREIELLSFL